MTFKSKDPANTAEQKETSRVSRRRPKTSFERSFKTLLEQMQAEHYHGSVLFTGEAGIGKAQPLDAKILTPTGWTTMGNIKIGDEVITPSGKASKVIGYQHLPHGCNFCHTVYWSMTFSDSKH